MARAGFPFETCPAVGFCQHRGMFPLPPPGQGQTQKAPPPIVYWVIWFALTVSVPIYQFVLGGGLPGGVNAPASGLSPIVIMMVGQILAATAVRWLVLPRCRRPQQVFVMMILGLALSEGAGLLGIFLIPHDQPETKLSLFVLSLLSCAQFMPVYARATMAERKFN